MQTEYVTPAIQRTGGRLAAHLAILSGFIALLWLLEFVDFVLPGQPLDEFGIRPRTFRGLIGIPCAPFLHGGFAHLIANSVPLLMLGWLVMVRRTSDFFLVFLVSALVGGLGTWLFGWPMSNHIGASGVVFGMLGCLLFRGLFERSLVALLLSLVVGFLFGGMLLVSIIPQPSISWSGHAFGFGGGIVAARILAEGSRGRTRDV